MIIGITSYINAYPFYEAFQHGHPYPNAQLIFAPPAELNKMFREGKLDIALISSVEFLRRQYHFLSPFGIGASEAIHSVNFYFKNWSSSMECHVTEESHTSIALLKVLAMHFWKIDLEFKPLDMNNLQSYSSFLLIGNQALEHQTFFNFQRIDLAAEWFKYTGKEFIFALFASHEMNDHALHFSQQLDSALKWSETNLDQIISSAKKKSSHSQKFLKAYYKSHIYRLSEKTFEGLNLFKTLLNHVS